MIRSSASHAKLQPIRSAAVPRVLSIAGSDPSGGAGIQADLKSIGANGGYGMAVICALTAQNTQEVRAVHVPPAHFLRDQLAAVRDDIEIDAVKIGMLADATVIGVVSDWLDRHRPPIVVLDPVMIASNGARLLDPDAEVALRRLLHQADLITPNLPELGALLCQPEPTDWPTAVQMAFDLAVAYDTKVLLKGGHFTDELVKDALISIGEAPIEFEAVRIKTANTHGTGCSLSSAIATRQALNGDWAKSLQEAKEWLHGAVARGAELRVGSGHGPVHHFHRWQQASATASWWQDIEPIRDGILALPFIQGLCSGELSERDFAYYLAQDALYLRDYSRALARASALAPTEEEQLFWAKSAANCLEVESELHRTWLREHPAELVQGPVTKRYVDHFLAASTMDYQTLVAAVLPCFWLYAWVGLELAAQRSDDGEHPYAAWLDTYADEEFFDSTAQAIRYVEQAAATATEAQLKAMRAAFIAASQYELDFFDAPRVLLGEALGAR